MSMKPQQQIALEPLRESFGVDTTTAEGLHGQELNDWIERQEGEAFERWQDEQRSLVNSELRISAHRGRHFRLMVDGIST